MEISLSFAIFIYLTTLVLLFLVLWLLTGKRKKAEDFTVLEERLWKCPVCSNVYVDSQNPDISPCPRCKTLNKRDDMEQGGLYGGTTDNEEHEV